LCPGAAQREKERSQDEKSLSLPGVGVKGWQAFVFLAPCFALLVPRSSPERKGKWPGLEKLVSP